MAESYEDERLLAEIAAALAPPAAVPPAALEAARAVYTWRTVDAELAELTSDSALAGGLAGVRGAPPELRTLTFEVGETTIVVEIGAAEIVGQVVPPRAGTGQVEAVGAALTAFPVDELGSFTAPLPAGAFRLSYTPEDGHRVVTTWIRP